ncbi:hypothetical protein BD779DRAFT_1437561 [Infundibulicybe gibba]|nr:hypothetical protein BD779DRAFT_1437561 [Infundibulicybe gibba]
MATTEAEFPLQESLYSTLQKFQNHTALPKGIHPFATSIEESCNTLQNLIHATSQVSDSLSTYLTTPLSDPKLISLLHQKSQFSQNTYPSNHHGVEHIIDSLRTRPETRYGEDIPLDRSLIANWCISRLETWGVSAGMETFRDESRIGNISVVLGGKVLVVDVDFSIEGAETSTPKITSANVKTSYAISNNPTGSAPTTAGSVSLDACLKGSIHNFCLEVQKPEESHNPIQAKKLGITVLQQLRYLVMLDKLAARSDDGGLKWFVDIDQLCPVLEEFARCEAEAVASSLSLTQAPLDIFLLRSHALPLPYLQCPSISFLVYVSPLDYLTLRRLLPLGSTQSGLPQLDTPLDRIREHVPSYEGSIIATLSLSAQKGSQMFPASMSMPTLSTRPNFPLVPKGSELEHVFPQLAESSVPNPESSHSHYVWTLDFTDGGKHRGVVMSQSRLRDIELVVNPLGGMGNMNPVNMMSFGNGSWVDHLLNLPSAGSPERYSALYKSPTNAHPPLELRLAPPDEPGFILEKVPVNSMKEIWGILEIVREQCWLNGILLGCQWSTQPLPPTSEVQGIETPANDEELGAVLRGTVTPRKIPVNVFLPFHSTNTDSLFDGANLEIHPRTKPRIVMTCPERPPISGLVEITVMYDETKLRGVSTEISGAMGLDIKSDVLEEICRRGGTLSLPGRIWAKAN